MRRFLSHVRALSIALTLTALMIGLAPLPAVKAQSATSSIPITLYRWRVSDSNYGYMLHQSLSAGQNLGYTNEGSVYDNPFISLRAGIIPPQPPGYTPAPGNPLIPIYQWRVVQGGRTYYYYSGPSFGGGPGYYFEGQLGWVLPASYDGSARDQNGRPIIGVAVNYYYSQSYGYWYTNRRPESGQAAPGNFPDAQNPGNSTYHFQGVGFQLPAWDPGSFQNPPEFFFVPPPPPPSCDPMDEQACYNNGGSWDPSTCSCSYINPDPDPQPCRPGMICEAYSPTQQTAKPAPAPETPPQE